MREEWSTLKKLIWLRGSGAGGGGSATYETATGNPVSFTTLRSAPLKTLGVEIAPVQSGTGDPSPDNVRPISGISTASVYVGRKNLFGGTYNANFSLFIKRGTTITISTANGSSNVRFNAYDIGGSRYYNSGVNTFDSTLNRKVRTITVTQDTYAVKFDSFDAGDYQIEFGSTATPYEAYDPASTSVSLSIGQTVYGGTLNVLTGVLTVTWGMGLLKDIVTSDYAASNSRHFFQNKTFCANYGCVIPSSDTQATESICSAFSPLTQKASWTNGTFSINGVSATTGTKGTLTFILSESVCNTLADFVATYGDNQLVFPLATPTTIQLVPAQVSTLLGNNVMWTNAHELTAEYQSN